MEDEQNYQSEYKLALVKYACFLARYDNHRSAFQMVCHFVVILPQVCFCSQMQQARVSCLAATDSFHDVFP